MKGRMASTPRGRRNRGFVSGRTLGLGGLWMQSRSLFLGGVLSLPLICLTGCGGFLLDEGFYPLPTIHLIYPTPAEVGLPYEYVEFDTQEGQRLPGWFIPAQNARAVVLFHHGAFFNRSVYLAHYQLFHNLGCNILAYEYQGFGESLTLARIETILGDADAALAYLRQRGDPGSEKVVLFGISLGTLPALAQAAAQPDGVVGVIVEGTVHQQVLSDLGFSLLGIIPSPESLTNLPPELNPDLNVTQITMPKLFIQSIEDIMTPFIGAEILFNAAPEPKTLIQSFGTHGLGVYTDPNYSAYVGEFLASVTGDG